MSATRKDPTRFRECSVPHETAEKADEALRAFYEDVDAARVKHRIAQVALVSQVNYVMEEGRETAAYSVSHIGDGLHQEAMMAYGYGVAKTLREETIADALSRKNKRSA